MVMSHPLARDEIIRSVTVFSGWTTVAGAAGGTTLVDGKLVGVNDFVTNKLILIMSGACKWEVQRCSSFVAGTGTITTAAFSAQIAVGVSYKILSFGSGADVAAIQATLAALLADLGDASASTLGSIYAILGNPAATLSAGLASILADTDSIDTATGILHEQADVLVTIDAILASETNVLNLATATTRYLVRHLRLKCADPGANNVYVRLYELVNDVLTNVDTFTIDAGNFATYLSLMDMFGLPHLAGDQLKVTVQSSAGGPYAVTGQYSHAKTNN